MNVTKRDLRTMGHQRLNIFWNMFADLRPLVHDTTEILDTNSDSGAWHEYNALMNRCPCTEHARHAHGTLTPN